MIINQMYFLYIALIKDEFFNGLRFYGTLMGQVLFFFSYISINLGQIYMQWRKGI